MALKKTRTMCTTCHARCGVLVYSDEDNRHRQDRGRSLTTPKSLGVDVRRGHVASARSTTTWRGALLYPMKRVDWDPKGERGPENRGKSAFERISWDEAHGPAWPTSACASRPAYGPEAIVTGQGTGRVANHWHVPA